jgi:hypothetical protein
MGAKNMLAFLFRLMVKLTALLQKLQTPSNNMMGG